jgi:hypothetical protein
MTNAAPTRRYQEDRTSVHTLQLDPGELRFSLGRHGVDWGGGLGSSSGKDGSASTEATGTGGSAEGQPKEETAASPELEKQTRATRAGLEMAGQVGYFAIFDG